MIFLQNINLADAIQNHYQCLARPAPLSPARWKEIIFDVDLAAHTYPEFAHRMPRAETVRKNFGDIQKWIPQYLENSLANMFDLSFIQGKPGIPYDTLDAVLQKARKNRVKLLQSHGDTQSHHWFAYEYKNKVFEVQDWIDKNSGADSPYGCLIISACNPGGITPYFRGTSIFYAKGIAGNPFWNTFHLADAPNTLASLLSKSFAEYKRTRCVQRQIGK